VKKSRIPEIIISLIFLALFGYIILFLAPNISEEQQILASITFIAAVIGVAFIYGELRTRLEQ
jgi:DMSO reductase anchor subunit